MNKLYNILVLFILSLSCPILVAKEITLEKDLDINITKMQLANSIEDPTIKDIWITIFIHGSFSLRPHLNIKNILKMLTDTIEESIYYRSTEINRRDPFFYKNQAMSDLGLHKINTSVLTNTLAAPIVATIFEQISQIAGYPPSDHYYTFGWSGLVSNKLRFLEAELLYRKLLKIINQLRQEGCNPKVRLIGYSHGGNLALQLGAIYQKKPQDQQITIDEFYLLGTPIQVETDYLVNSPIFKRVFNFYSSADKVQTLDFFSFKRFFSKRKFEKRRNFTLPDKLTQVQLKITDYKLKKRKSIPKNIQEKDLNKYYTKIILDPGHFELWFMGWTILTYRKEFPTNPLPILVFLPLLSKYIQQHPQLAKNLTVEFIPIFNTIEIYSRYQKKKSFKTEKLPFVDRTLLESFKDQARQLAPDNYNLTTYNRKVYDAINIASDEFKKIQTFHKQKRKNLNIPQKINLQKNNSTYQGHLSNHID